MKSIWYFVGLMFIVMGAIIFLSGLYALVSPPPEHKVFSHLHPDLWWGFLMLVFGVAFSWFNRRNIVR